MTDGSAGVDPEYEVSKPAGVDETVISSEWEDSGVPAPVSSTSLFFFLRRAAGSPGKQGKGLEGEEEEKSRPN